MLFVSIVDENILMILATVSTLSGLFKNETPTLNAVVEVEAAVTSIIEILDAEIKL